MHKQQSLVRTAELTVLSARAHADDHALLTLFMCNKQKACKERKSKLERRYDTGG